MDESLSSLLMAFSGTGTKQLSAKDTLDCYFELILLLLDGTAE
jgi:hypothetical protein